MVHVRDNKRFCSQGFASLPTQVDPITRLTSKSEACMVDWLLECTQKKGISWLYQERTPKHTCCVCSCQLYQWIATYKCHYPTTFETCVQSQFVEITNLQGEGTTHWFQDEQSQTSNLWMVAFNMDTSVGHGWNDYQRLGQKHGSQKLSHLISK